MVSPAGSSRCIHTQHHVSTLQCHRCELFVQDKRALQQQLSSESSARVAAEQQLHVLERQLSSASAECSNCKTVGFHHPHSAILPSSLAP